MRKLFAPSGHPERRRGRWRQPNLARGRLWLAVLGMATLPAVGGVLITSSLLDEPDAAIAAEQNRLTATAAAELLVREQGIEARLAALATDPALVGFTDGLSNAAERQSAQAALARLRGSDEGLVSGACISRVSDGRVTMLGPSVSGVTSVSSCGSGALLAQAARSPLGEVVRAPTRMTAGQRRLQIATRVASHAASLPASASGGGSVAPAVLVGEIDLAELFRQTESASTVAPTALLVDGMSSDIVAGSSRPADPGLMSRQPLEPREVAVYVRGILTDHAPAIEDLAAAGWVTSVSPLWPTLGGSEIGLIHVWPKPVPVATPAMVLGLIGLGAAALLAALLFMRHLIRPFHDLEESQEQLATMYREAREESLHDGLTGMGNHRAFREELTRQFAHYERDGVPFSLMIVDLDNLKIVNDREGHAEGDRLLVSLTNAMREAFRKTDRLFRTGGDEFAVILPDTEPEQAVSLAGRLQHYCARPTSGERPMRFSGGISAVPQFASDANQLYRQADVALYWAKRHGRGFVELFDADRDEVPGDSGAMGLDNAIYEIIRTRAISPVFQPIVDLRTGAVLGFEGLVRPDPAGPFPDSHRLFAAAAATGRTVELDLAAMEVVAEGARGISSDHIVSINLSARTLEVNDFDAAWLLATLQRHGISPTRVILELTEREPISDIKRLQRNIHHLGEYGLRLAADDVGAGNAGLRLLSQVPFDVVKIDLSLVQEAARNTVTWAVLRSLRDFARRQDAVVIGEGVETPEQLSALRQLDIPVGQGYLLGRPQPHPDLSSVRLDELAALGVGPPPAPSTSTGPVPQPSLILPPAPLLPPGPVPSNGARPASARGHRTPPIDLRQLKPQAIPVAQP